jgi:hypothetical protein
MSCSLLGRSHGLVAGTAIFISSLALATTATQAATVVVPYAGSFNESTVAAEGGLPAGDYDTIGGLDDVAQFNLVAGTNIFSGGIFTPDDSSDVFLINIGANQTLIGASIAFGTNLTEFAPMFAFPPPHWVLEESSPTPTIFDLIMGFDGMDVTQNTTAPGFSKGAGFYSMLIGNGTFGVNAGNFKTPIFYTMTFDVVERISSVPLPAALPLLAGGLGLLGFAGVRRRRTTSG